MKRSITQQTRGWGRGRCIEIHQDNSPEQRGIKRPLELAARNQILPSRLPLQVEGDNHFRAEGKKKEMSYGAKRLEEGSPLGLGICTTGRSLNVTIATNTRDELSVQTNRSGVVIRHGSKNTMGTHRPTHGHAHTHTTWGPPALLGSSTSASPEGFQS